MIVGPTSSGKTSLAVDLCKEFNGEIVSADSRQIYKYMDIGTGKIPAAVGGGSRLQSGAATPAPSHQPYVLNEVSIWGYDLVEPGEYFSAHDYALWAREKISEINKRGKTVFLVGGTGFYIDLVTGRAKTAGVEPDLNLRNNLEKLSLPQLQKKLMSLNLEAYEKLDKNNPARLIRAIEVEVGEQHSPTLPKLNTDFEFVGLTASREFLYNRADKWLDFVWENGLLEEKADLNKKFPGAKQLDGLVYKSARDGNKEKTKFDLHSYIRRQQTWFKKNKFIKWFDIQDPNFAQNVSNHVESK